MVQPRRHTWLVRTLATAVLAWGALAPAHAAPPSKPARLGLCAACHGETGMAQIPGAPNLAGQKLDYLREALKQYRDGRRNVPLMRAAIGPVSDADLDELARWYSAQTLSVPSNQGNP
ncbi:Cytochrome c553 [Dyella jiangningensis]|uniref:c-type cytochrome n=1 Tax=Dyella sp. AtDHG13 TaxID=1938897 RepID=UPI00088EA453|nr:c-type cytochrome [Dyella sp. AtDHG13]PXV59558.1 cytochrome c553 [Dyella sp. AtDHG13]SDJ32329.1 Cytochrome c553 [Dyella jiangningensis]